MQAEVDRKGDDAELLSTDSVRRVLFPESADISRARRRFDLLQAIAYYL